MIIVDEEGTRTRYKFTRNREARSWGKFISCLSSLTPSYSFSYSFSPSCSCMFIIKIGVMWETKVSSLLSFSVHLFFITIIIIKKTAAKMMKDASSFFVFLRQVSHWREERKWCKNDSFLFHVHLFRRKDSEKLFLRQIHKRRCK